jgi:hypothetical protein
MYLRGTIQIDLSQLKHRSGIVPTRRFEWFENTSPEAVTATPERPVSPRWVSCRKYNTASVRRESRTSSISGKPRTVFADRWHPETGILPSREYDHRSLWTRREKFSTAATRVIHENVLVLRIVWDSAISSRFRYQRISASTGLSSQ